MRRSQFSGLTEVKSDAIDNLARRNVFPFLRHALDDAKGWSDYPPRVAFMTMLALELANAGATLEKAGRFVAVEFDELLGQRTVKELLTGDIWFGFIKWANWEFDLESNRRERWQVEVPLCGSMDETSARLKALKERDVANLKYGASPSEFRRLVLINASERLRLFQFNAADQGLPKSTVRLALSKNKQP
jgi:hypothetical protein